MKSTEGKIINMEKKSVLYIIIIGILLVIAILAGGAFFLEQRKEKSLSIAEDISMAFTDWEEATESGKEEEMKNLESLIDKGLEFGGLAKERALFTKGLISLKDEDWETAASAFEEVFNTSPKSYLAPTSICNAAQSLDMLDKTEEAIALYEKALEEYPTDLFQRPNIYFNLGRLYLAKGDNEKSNEYFEKVLTDFPDSNWADIINQYKIISEI